MPVDLEELRKLSRVPPDVRDLLAEALPRFVDEGVHNSINGTAVINVMDSMEFTMDDGRVVRGLTAETRPLITQRLAEHEERKKFYTERSQQLEQFIATVGEDIKRVQDHIKTMDPDGSKLEQYRNKSNKDITDEAFNEIKQFIEEHPEFVPELERLAVKTGAASQAELQHAISQQRGLKKNFIDHARSLKAAKDFMNDIVAQDAEHIAICTKTARELDQERLALRNERKVSDDLRNQLRKLSEKRSRDLDDLKGNHAKTMQEMQLALNNALKIGSSFQDQLEELSSQNKRDLHDLREEHAKAIKKAEIALEHEREVSRDLQLQLDARSRRMSQHVRDLKEKHAQEVGSLRSTLQSNRV